MKKSIFGNFQAAILVVFSLTSAAAIFPFAIYRLSTGQIYVAILDLSLVAFIISIVTFAWKTGKIELAGRVVVIFNCVGAFISSEMLGVVGVFWMYVVILTNFFLTTSLRYACAVTFITLFLLAAHAKSFESSPQMWSFLVTSSLLASLSFTVAYQNAAQKKKLETLASTDALTGALNRRVMISDLENSIETFSRHEVPMCLLLMDIDHFKKINDTFGHEAGDNVLVLFSKLVRLATRQLDKLYRYGGEEFLLLIPSAQLDEALAIAEKIRLECVRSIALGESAVTVSIGVAKLEKGESWKEWTSRADMALYQAKQSGRNRVAFNASPTA